MKRLLQRIKRGGARGAARAGETEDDSGFFRTQFQDASDDPLAVANWAERATLVEAKPLDRRQGTDDFMRLWGSDRHVVVLRPEELQRMSQYMEFVSVGGGKELIRQDELGDYMIIVLGGNLSVDRVQPWGGRTRMAEAHAGDMLGEMSLLDAGARFSSCVTLTPCTLAVIDARRLDEMITQEPRLGLALLASLSRRLSLRLRQVSARLGALLSQD